LAITAVLMTACGGGESDLARMADTVYRNATLAPRPPGTFTSDGCSCWPDGNWVVCCVQHDLAYWVGGTRDERRAADRALEACVSKAGHPVVARMMYYGSQLGGVWWLPTPFRWGFGWPYPQTGPPGKSY
jgi:hypothetical protein